MSVAIRFAESGWLPDIILRRAMRSRMTRRLALEAQRDAERWLKSLAEGPVAVATEAANSQHYEVPAQLFVACLGSHLKYSCGYWPDGVSTLDESEAAMLALSSERAELRDGQHILELGCGWGSWSLWMAEHYPSSSITSISNSSTQRAFIESTARDRGLSNLTVITADMRDFEIDQTFDRVVSIEMFEHMRNYDELLKRVRRWLSDDGKAFIHIFCHRQYCYPFEVDGGKDWMARHFFTGGIMPSFDLLQIFSRDLQVEKAWRVDGQHYEKTANAWLEKLDTNRQEAYAALAPVAPNVNVAIQRWRMFFMACAELFGYANGGEWFVGHYRLTPAEKKPA